MKQLFSFLRPLISCYLDWMLAPHISDAKTYTNFDNFINWVLFIPTLSLDHFYLEDMHRLANYKQFFLIFNLQITPFPMYTYDLNSSKNLFK
jgi:hypothetical protein